MPQFALNDANWRRFLEDMQRCRQQGVAVPPVLVAEMVRARAEGLICDGYDGDITAATQAAKAQLGTVNPDANASASESAVIALYPNPLC